MASAQIPSLHGHADGVAWRPTQEYIQRSRLRRFMSRLGIESFDELLAWAAAHPAEFWDATLRDLGLEFYRPYTTTLDTSRGLPWTRWFVGGLYNYAHDAVDKWAVGPRSASTALVWEGEEGATRRLSYAELYEEANRMAGALQAQGIGHGDRVGIFLPMIPETVIAMLAL